MSEQRRNQLRLLVRVLFGMAAAVIVFSIVGAIEIGTSTSQIPGFDEIQQQNRGTAALAALGGGLVGAGILAGLAGILTALIETGAPPRGETASPPGGETVAPPGEEPR